MSNDDILNRMSVIKDELENDIYDSVKVLTEIKNMINSENEICANDLSIIFKEFYKLHPTDNINDQIIDNIFMTDITPSNVVNNFINNLEIYNTESIFFNRNIHTINNDLNFDRNLSSLLSISEFTESNILDNINFDNSFLNNIEEQSFLPAEDIPIVLKEECFNKLIQLKYKDINKKYKKQDTCAISMEKFENNSDILILPCSHIFNLDECKKWLLNNSHKCPICRESVGENYPKLD
tara:strand:+ start:2466 stop:3179 length:714 start_codon:yes stop_codon:yes gene_type:complete